MTKFSAEWMIVRVMEGYETFMNHMPWYHFPYMSGIGLYWTTLAREVVSSLILLYFSSPLPLPPQWRSNLMSHIRHRLRGRNESGGGTCRRPAVQPFASKVQPTLVSCPSCFFSPLT